ncbi:MAG: hypothetical protein K2J96_04635 [Bacteroidaceae bacterium]|nr:hypothetical protein [Bacteroidaceae bacterium]
MPRNAQGQGTYQVQTQTQQLTPQQVLLVRLTELPVNDLRERVDKELADNPWLQGEPTEGMGGEDYASNSDSREHPDAPDAPDRQQMAEAADYGDAYDDVDYGVPFDPNANADRRMREQGDTSETFFDLSLIHL